MEAVGYNKALTCLELQWNSIGEQGSCALGRALRQHPTLQVGARDIPWQALDASLFGSCCVLTGSRPARCSRTPA